MDDKEKDLNKNEVEVIVENNNDKEEDKKTVKSFAKKLAKSIKKGAIKTGEYIESLTDKLQEYSDDLNQKIIDNQAFREAYKEATIKYEIKGVLNDNGLTQTIRAFKYEEINQLAIPLKEKYRDSLLINSVLKEYEGDKNLQLTEVTSDKTIYFKLKVKDKVEEIACILVKYEELDF